MHARRTGGYWRHSKRGHWLNAMLTALKAGIGTALLFACLLGYFENFMYGVTSRSLVVGAITALVIFLVLLCYRA